MEQRVLTDKNQLPTEEVIFSHIGRSRTLWKALFDYIHAEHADFAEEWRYYNDGKSWLLKVTRKKKTVFWLSVFENTFAIGAYFTDKYKKAIQTSTLSPDLKEQYLGNKKDKLRGIRITFRKKRDVEEAKTLIALKIS